MNPLHLDAVGVVQQGAGDLGFENYLELYRKALPTSALRRARRAVPRLPRLDRASLRDLGGQAVPRPRRRLARRGPTLGRAAALPCARVGPALPGRQDGSGARGHAPGFGIDLKSQENVTLDLDERPNKTRAFCAPIEVPDRVVLVIQPIGGPDDWRALFHEAGHTEHFAHTSRDLTMEEKRLGDNAVTEGWAMLLQHLTDEPEWLTKLLDFPRPHEYAVEGDRAPLLRAALCGEDPLRGRVPRRRRHHEDARTLRGAALGRAQARRRSGQLPRGHRLGLLRVRHTCARGRSRRSCARTSRRSSGRGGSRAAMRGSLLRELWGEGQKMRAEEMLKEVTGPRSRWKPSPSAFAMCFGERKLRFRSPV